MHIKGMQIRELSILELQSAGLRGLTAGELAINLGIDCLQASGALSNLHRDKVAYRLTAKREHKSVYTVDDYIGNKTHRAHGIGNTKKRLKGTWYEIEARETNPIPVAVPEALPMVGTPSIVLFQDDHFTLTWRA